LAAELNARGLAGIRFSPVSFTPAASKYAGTRCQGVSLLITDRLALRPVRMGLEIATALYRLYPETYRLETDKPLFGSAQVLGSIKEGEDPARVSKRWQADEVGWRMLRARYLLY